MIRAVMSTAIVFALILVLFAHPVLAVNTLSLSVGTDKTMYRLSDQLRITGRLIWVPNNIPATDGIVGVEVTDSRGSPFILRTLPTGLITSQNWLVNLTQLYPCDSNGVPKYAFNTNEAVFVYAEWKNFDAASDHAVETCITFYDANSVPIGWSSFYTLVSRNSTAAVLFQATVVTSSAVLGNVTMYGSLFNDFPAKGGYPYCPEGAAIFIINASSPHATSPSPLLSSNGTYGFSFTLPSRGLPFGTYTLYVTTNYDSAGTYYYVKNSATFGLLGILGDINGDGVVDIFDAVLMAGAFNSKPGSRNWNPNADLNSDGVVDIFDAVILAGHFGQGG